LLREEGGFFYTSDAYDDDLPYWASTGADAAGTATKGPALPPQLVIPYTLVINDMRYLMAHGYSSGEDFFAVLKDAFDHLWHEGARAPKMMSVGLTGASVVIRPVRVRWPGSWIICRASMPSGSVGARKLPALDEGESRAQGVAITGGKSGTTNERRFFCP
jgi:hypothetical protein